MLPRWENSQLVLHAAHGTGNWIGAASALIHDDYIYLAYRDRHPVEQGRGNRAYVAGLRRVPELPRFVWYVTNRTKSPC
jgi:hypothetical protein